MKKASGTKIRSQKPAFMKYFFIYLAILPTFILPAVFYYVPFVNAFIRSLFDYNGVTKGVFVGLDNFKELLFTDELFWPSVGRMALMTSVDIVKTTAIAIGVALIIHRLRNEKAKYFSRVLVVLPAVIPGMVSMLLWKNFVSENGIINEMLTNVGLEQLVHQWLGDEKTVLFTMMFIMGFPWINGANTLIFLAGLMQIDKSIYESVDLDGIKWWQKIFKIELPLIMPQVRIIVLMAIIGGIQGYENIQVITNGGPGNSSYVPGLILYNNAFRYSRFGYASAVGVVLFFMIIGFSILNNRLSRDKV